MCTLCSHIRSPFITLPVNCFCRSINAHALPPNVLIRSDNNVCKDCILLTCKKRIRIRLHACSRSNSEETCLRVNCPKSAVSTYSEPSDIVTNRPYLIAHCSVFLRRNKHCKVCFTASTWECSRYVLNITLRTLNAEDKHMLSHPTFFSAKPACYTKSKAFLTKKNVTAVARTD